MYMRHIVLVEQPPVVLVLQDGLQHGAEVAQVVGKMWKLGTVGHLVTGTGLCQRGIFIICSIFPT